MEKIMDRNLDSRDKTFKRFRNNKKKKIYGKNNNGSYI